MYYWVNLIGTIVYFVTILSCIIIVLRDNRNPIRALSWVIALIFLPIVGLIFYVFFGRSLRGQRMISRHNKRKLLTKITPHHVDLRGEMLADDELGLVKLARNIASSFYTVNNKVEIFTEGPEKFATMKRDLSDAKKTIYLQYYIFQDDNIGHEIAEILKMKAKEGLDVRVMYDHIGSFSSSNSFFKDMERAGVDTHPFFRVNFPQLANRINWRNHRKMVVIDNKIGYIGGMNIADRYAGSSKERMPWRDTHFRLEGDIVDALLYSFTVDWNFRDQKHILDYFALEPVKFSNHLGMQLVTSGPLGKWDNLALCFQKAISMAKRCIYIQTPYFLPTNALMCALEAAALGKVDVRIMIPRKPDSVMLRYASYSYISQCLKAGIKVYLYNPGMLHAKTMIVDDSFVTAGSTNFDFRSFENNFECNLLIYNSDINRQMRDIFFHDMGHCTKLNYEMWHKRPVLQRAWESVIRLVSPIL